MIKLYEHNKQGLQAVKERLKVVDRTAIVQPTGTGKSYLVTALIEDLNFKRVIIFSPSNYINAQFKRTLRGRPGILFLTYQRLINMGADEILALKPDLIVIDEFHRAGADKWGSAVLNLIDSFKGVKVVGTSATPVRYLDNQRDMSKELFGGDIAVNMDLSEAIVRGILPSPYYVSALYTLDEEVEKVKENIRNSKESFEDKNELFKRLENLKRALGNSKGIHNILKKHINDPFGKKFVVFCSSKEALNKMVTESNTWFKKAFPGIECENYVLYSGLNGNLERLETFKSVKNNKLHLLFTIDMFNEGLHLKELDGVILLRPTTSPIIFYQQLGRALTVGNTKKPFVFDLVNNADNLGSFLFLNNLKNTNKRINSKQGKNEYSSTLFTGSFTVFDEVSSIVSKLKKFNNSLNTGWDAWFALLVKYKKEYGGFPDSFYVTPDGLKLGQWVKTQRRFYSLNLLSQEKIALLNSIGFVWNVHDSQWVKMFNLLKKYLDEYNSYPAPHFITKEGLKLGRWVESQRASYKKKKLTQEKIDLLNSIGFIWSISDDSWEKMFYTLKMYVETHGSFPPVTYVTKDGLKLGRWVEAQRVSYKKKKLTQEKIDLLNSIGFEWVVRVPRWYKMFNLLKEFVEKYNSLPPTTFVTAEGIKLGQWVANQRYYFKINKLTQERIDLLNSIGLNLY